MEHLLGICVAQLTSCKPCSSGNFPSAYLQPPLKIFPVAFLDSDESFSPGNPKSLRIGGTLHLQSMCHSCTIAPAVTIQAGVMSSAIKFHFYQIYLKSRENQLALSLHPDLLYALSICWCGCLWLCFKFLFFGAGEKRRSLGATRKYLYHWVLLLVFLKASGERKL